MIYFTLFAKGKKTTKVHCIMLVWMHSKLYSNNKYDSAETVNLVLYF